MARAPCPETPVCEDCPSKIRNNNNNNNVLVIHNNCRRQEAALYLKGQHDATFQAWVRVAWTVFLTCVQNNWCHVKENVQRRLAIREVRRDYNRVWHFTAAER